MRRAVEGLGASELPLWLEAPAQGMNQDDIRGLASKPSVTRFTTIARATSAVGRQGKINRPPGRSAVSHCSGGSTTAALT